ncbi:MAG: three-Cys-motif partner protein TcmP, partial [Candidatus Sulfotelmatobacter sp.]
MLSAFAGFDEIGYWSEIKLDIVREYAAAYSRILTAKNLPHVYIDAFAGAGQHLSRQTREFVAGSPLNALKVEPPFKEYHFIDLNAAKMDHLQSLAGANPNVRFYHADCNEVLMHQVFPTLAFTTYRRALCLLDPYGLHLQWRVVKANWHTFQVLTKRSLRMRELLSGRLRFAAEHGHIWW